MVLVLSIVSTLHLAAVLFAAAAPCYALWLEWNATRRSDPLADALGLRISKLAITGLVAGMLLGGLALALLWLQDAQPYFRGLAVIPVRRLWFGAAELAVYFLGMAAYVRWWRTMPRPLHRFLAIFNATNLLYHFPPLFSAIAVASTRPRLWNSDLNYRQTLSLFGEGETLARTLHVILAGFAIGGVVLMWLAWRRLEALQAAPASGGTPADDPPPAGESAEASDHPAVEAHSPGELAGTEQQQRAARWLRRGAGAGLVFTALQLPAGVLLLVALPTASRDRLLLGDLWSTAMLLAAVVFAVALLHLLTAAALGDRNHSVVRNAAVCLALVMLLMVSARHRARDLQYQSFQSRELAGAKTPTPGHHSPAASPRAARRSREPSQRVPALTGRQREDVRPHEDLRQPKDPQQLDGARAIPLGANFHP